MAFSTTSKKSGKLYWLNSKEVTMKGGRKMQIYFFSSNERPETACDLPDTHEVGENANSGLPLLRRRKEAVA